MATGCSLTAMIRSKPPSVVTPGQSDPGKPLGEEARRPREGHRDGRGGFQEKSPLNFGCHRPSSLRQTETARPPAHGGQPDPRPRDRKAGALRILFDCVPTVLEGAQ